MADTLLVYADTSVYGGVFDREFASPSRRFFEAVQTGTFELLVSDVVRREIESAPQQVQDHFTNHLGFMRRIAFDEPVLKLRDAYLASRILEP
ncbi:MAG: hypothetical protein HY269_09075, partial [Deltaproteobacteria bacterium]|nr:hypothetical protein [Deltaproteobacteria bacterium]